MADKALTFDLIGRDRLSPAMKKAEASTKKTHDALGLLGKIGGLGLGALAASAVTMGIKTAASMEQAQIGFTQLLGSTQKAKAYMGDLTKFAAATPFEFPGLVDASRLLLGVGVASQQVIPMLTDFGDAAGALAIDQSGFQRIMQAMSQSISSGRLQLGDLNQLMNNGLPIYSLLSKALGKPVATIRDMATKGQLLTKDVLPKLQEQMHKDYGGAMAKQSQTLSGVWSTLMDTMSQGLAGVIQPLLPTIRDAIPKAADLMGKAFKAAGDGLSALVGAFKDGKVNSDGFVGSMERVGVALRGAADFIKKNSDLILPLAGYLLVITAAVRAWTAAQVILNLTLAGNPIGLVVLAIAALGAVLVVAYQRSETFRNIVDTTFRVISTVVATAISIIKGHLDIFIVALLGPVGVLVVLWRNSQTFRDIAVAAFGAVATAGSVMWAALKDAFRWITNAFLTLVGVIVTGAASAFGWVPGIGPKLKQAAKDFDQFKNDVNAALDGIPKTLTVYVKGVWVAPKVPQGSQYSQVKPARGIGALASGGPARPGAPYWVGEDGPELVTFGSSSYVHDSKSSRRAIAGGSAAVGGDTHVHIHTPAVITSDRDLVRLIDQALARVQRSGSYVPRMA